MSNDPWNTPQGQGNFVPPGNVPPGYGPPGYGPPGYGPPNGGFQRPKNSGSNTTIIILVVFAVLFIPCTGILVGLLLPAVHAARESARRMSCSNNLKEIALALHNYESDYKMFPPAYTVDANGRPLHSWRTLILPYLGESNLYNSIDLTKPWDDPINQRANDVVIRAYSCPSTRGANRTLTCYQTISDPASVFPGSTQTRIGGITDGTSNTLMVVESAEVDAVPWMKPQDLPFANFLNPTSVTHHTGGANVALCDGSIQFISKTINPANLRSMMTRAGGD